MTAKVFCDGAHRAPLQQDCKPCRVRAIINHGRDTYWSMLLWSPRDRDARRPSGDGLLSLRELPALFRRAGERVHVWKKENVSVTKGEEFLGRFKSSDISERGYCTKCGSHLTVEHPTLGLMDVRIGALRNFPFKPKVHLNYAETILPMKDGLPKLKDFPAEIGGSGETLPE
jgi:hypothetical protein